MNASALSALAAAYLLGSLPFSYLVARLAGIRDVREVGSGNVGATNVMRSAGKAAGIAAFVLDFAKGLAAVLLAMRLSLDPGIHGAAAAIAVIGHMWPVWLGFRGGKGVATGAGVFLPLAPQATGLALLAFPLLLALTRYVSVASMGATGVLVLLAGLFGAPGSVVASTALVAVLIVFRHRGNISRIAQGTESRLGRAGRQS